GVGGGSGLLGARPAEVLRGAADGPGGRAVRAGDHPAVVCGGTEGDGASSGTATHSGRGRGVATATASGAVGATAEVLRAMAGQASVVGPAQEPVGRGGGLRAEPVGGTTGVHDVGLPGDRQQRGGAGLACRRHRTKKLLVLWE